MALHEGDFPTAAFKFVPGFGPNRYQVVQHYPSGSRQAVYYIDRKGRFNGYLSIYKPDGKFAFVTRYRHGKPAKGWSEEDYVKLKTSDKPVEQGKLDGLYSTVGRYGSLYIKLDKDKGCRYYGYTFQGEYVSIFGTWSIAGRYLTLSSKNEDGSTGEPFRRFLIDKHHNMIEINPRGYWDPDLTFRKN